MSAPDGVCTCETCSANRNYIRASFDVETANAMIMFINSDKIMSAEDKQYMRQYISARTVHNYNDNDDNGYGYGNDNGYAYDYAYDDNVNSNNNNNNDNNNDNNNNNDEEEEDDLPELEDSNLPDLDHGAAEDDNDNKH